MSSGDDFYGRIPVFRGFGDLMDPALYVALPGDWSIGLADIVQSTQAIAAQRYKAVNMAGAAVISAVTNALDGREFPSCLAATAPVLRWHLGTSIAPARHCRRRHAGCRMIST
jgi:hypothetical protein